MKNLTRREQILMFILIMFLIIAGFFLLIIQPLNKDIAKSKVILADLKNKKTEIDLKIASESSIESNLNNAIISVSEKFDQIESPLFAATFERWSIPYLVNNQVTMTGLTVSEPKLSVPDVPTYQNMGFDYELRKLVDSYNLVVVDTKSIPLTEAQLVRTTVEFKFNTTYAVYVKFLDEIAFWDTTAFVTHSAYDFTQAAGSVIVDYYTTEKIMIDPIVE